MSTFTSQTIYLLAVILFYLPSFWARYAFSGKKYSTGKYFTTMSYNLFFGIIHIDFLRKGTLPFIGSLDNSTLGWLSLAALIAYAFSLPDERARTPWFKKRS